MSTHRDRIGRGGGRLRGFTLAALAPLLASAAACTVFDGLSVPDASSTSSSAGGGVGGVGGAGGVGNGGGGAETGTGGGTGGGSSSTGTAAGGGGAGGSVSEFTTYLGPGKGLRVCTMAFMCPQLSASIARSIGVPIDNDNVSQCISWVSGPIAKSRPGFSTQEGILLCIANALDCAQASACLPVEEVDPGDAICDSGTKCLDMDTALDCSSHLIYRCATEGFNEGSKCSQSGDAIACSTGSCGTVGEATCEGDTLATCTGAGMVRTPCKVAGLTCGMSSGKAACVGAGSCSAPGAATCEGGAAHVCSSHEESVFDCASFGAQCASEVQDEARCDLPDAACKPSDSSATTCSANKQKITVCLAGQAALMGCPGVTTCIAADGGKSAHCG